VAPTRPVAEKSMKVATNGRNSESPLEVAESGQSSQTGSSPPTAHASKPQVMVSDFSGEHILVVTGEVDSIQHPTTTVCFET
jgi:hypothetical protein